MFPCSFKYWQQCIYNCKFLESIVVLIDFCLLRLYVGNIMPHKRAVRMVSTPLTLLIMLSKCFSRASVLVTLDRPNVDL